MSRRIIIHIGPAKTGTSSLQEALYAARAALEAEGIAYPSLGRHDQMPRLPGHHGLPAVLAAGGQIPQALLDWIGALPPEQAVVLSSENFAHLALTGIATLRDQLTGITGHPPQVEVVYYARCWDRLLPSVWQELVKHGDSRPYLSFLNIQTTAPRASFYLNYAMVLERWAQVFGMKALRLFSFDGLQAQGLDLVDHFTKDVLGIAAPIRSDDDLEGVLSANLSWPVPLIETLRGLNALSYGTAQGTADVRIRLQENADLVAEEIDALEAYMTPYLRRARPYAPFLMYQIESEILARFGPALGNPTSEGRLFVQGAAKETEYVDGNYLLNPEALALLQDIHRKLELPQPPG